jgi:hypothetical protein
MFGKLRLSFDGYDGVWECVGHVWAATGLCYAKCERKIPHLSFEQNTRISPIIQQHDVYNKEWEIISAATEFFIGHVIKLLFL